MVVIWMRIRPSGDLPGNLADCRKSCPISRLLKRRSMPIWVSSELEFYFWLLSLKLVIFHQRTFDAHIESMLRSHDCRPAFGLCCRGGSLRSGVDTPCAYSKASDRSSCGNTWRCYRRDCGEVSRCSLGSPRCLWQLVIQWSSSWRTTRQATLEWSDASHRHQGHPRRDVQRDAKRCPAFRRRLPRPSRHAEREVGPRISRADPKIGSPTPRLGLR